MVLLWMGLIFSFSQQPAVESKAVSREVVREVAPIVHPGFHHLEPKEQESIIANMHGLVRKQAHSALYFALAILSMGALAMQGKKGWVRIFISLTICLLFAMSDEFHQTYVPGRSGEWRDVAIDFGGALLGVLIFQLLAILLGRLRKKKYR